MGMSRIGVSVTAIAAGLTSAQRQPWQRTRMARRRRCDLGAHPTRDFPHDEAGLAGAAMASGRASSIGTRRQRRRCDRLAGQDDVVGIAEYEDLRSAPDDTFRLHHRLLPQPKNHQLKELSIV